MQPITINEHLIYPSLCAVFQHIISADTDAGPISFRRAFYTDRRSHDIVEFCRLNE